MKKSNIIFIHAMAEGLGIEPSIFGFRDRGLNQLDEPSVYIGKKILGKFSFLIFYKYYIIFF